MVGMLHWYASVPPLYLRFGTHALREWFSGVRIPCIMRGSIYALRMQGEERNCRKSFWAEEVLERIYKRWLRKTKPTILYREEWHQLLDANKDAIWSRCKRLRRYGWGKWDAFDWLYPIVSERSGMDAVGRIHGCEVLLNGEQIYLENERLEYVRKMWAVHGKLPA
jgi:hypothetical protein